MLKSTYKPAGELPPGWTQHRAPTGRLYYYHAETQTSTYQRPAAMAAPMPASVAAPTEISHAYGGAGLPQPAMHAPQYPFGMSLGAPGQSQALHWAHGQLGQQQQQQSQQRPPRRKLEDRPKHKYQIPGHDGWFLVKTKLRRRFVYNAKTNESFWTFPEEIAAAVRELDKTRKDGKGKGGNAGTAEGKPEPGASKGDSPTTDAQRQASAQQGPVPPGETTTADDEGTEEDDSEYEEVEVTDDEGEGGTARPQSPARQRDENAPLELTEEDFAYQLEAMGAGDDGDGYGYVNQTGEHAFDQDWQAGEEQGHDDQEGLTEEDAVALFEDLLDDYQINPYSPWERVIEDGRIIDDGRYTVLTTMKARREVHAAWSKARIASLKEARAKQEKKDPRICYVAFLEQNANGRLYWAEFKRKFRKTEEMRDVKLPDRDKEKMYREHVSRLKLPQSTKVEDLRALLRSVPLQQLNGRSTVEALPTPVLVDLRYVSLPAAERDELIRAYIASLPDAPDRVAGGEDASMTAEERMQAEKRRADREKREQALRMRKQQVEREKKQAQWEQTSGRHLLEMERAEVQRAMRVDRDGSRSYIAEGGEQEGRGSEASDRADGGGEPGVSSPH
ncbi:hypothetical protein KEM52_000415 [Ascosphaera acerosa]|nr:hypothetical protein KEM52_000415 [Ascosphaera acerosa]